MSTKKENLILLIESATAVCSIALAKSGTIIAKKELNTPNIHASHITLLVDEVMHIAKEKYSNLDAVAVSQGPGSYTGLRIGVSTAKGLCFALGIPLIGINTLKAMARGIIEKQPLQSPNLLLCPMIDARRMEVYTTLLDHNMQEIEEVKAKILDESSFISYLKKYTILFFGDGSSKIKSLYQENPNALFVEFENSASYLGNLAEQKLQNGEVEDLAYFEPFYLKNFIPTKAKDKIGSA